MIPALNTALSALTANSAAIDVTGNNLANLNTTGFKATQVGFSDLMSQSLGSGGSGQLGIGVGQISTNAIFTQGSITNTAAPLDAAVQGNGFFVVKDQGTNQQLYTRDGTFGLDSSGNLVTQGGQLVQGWSAANGVVDTNGTVGNITVPLGSVIPATATVNMSGSVNLNALGAVGAANGTFSAPIQVYDSLGNSHTLTMTFTKTDVNKWDYSVTLPAADYKGPGAPAALATGHMTFDTSGNITAPLVTDPPIPVKITNLLDGAADQTVNWNVFDAKGNAQITQFAQASGLGGTTQDGFAAGQVVKVSMGNGGAIIANYSNGKQATVGQVALATIGNPETMVSVGGNNLQASATTGQPAIGAANSGGRGQIVGGALESSTSDMATEFTHLLTYERSYQAASRVITTSDQLAQETVNLIHG